MSELQKNAYRSAPGVTFRWKGEKLCCVVKLIGSYYGCIFDYILFSLNLTKKRICTLTKIQIQRDDKNLSNIFYFVEIQI